MDILVTGETPMGLRAHHPVKGQLFHVKEKAVQENKFINRAHEAVLSAITLIGLALMVAGIMH